MMGYWVAVQISTMRSSVIHKSKLRMGDMTLRRFLMISCEIFLRNNLISAIIIDIIGC